MYIKNDFFFVLNQNKGKRHSLKSIFCTKEAIVYQYVIVENFG